jgi:hypothetical protein
MLSLEHEQKITVHPCKAEDIPKDVFSVIGHADTAKVLSNLLGFEVPVNRIAVKLSKFDVLYVAQVVGGRLPEGSTTLPDGFEIRFVEVRVD